MSNIPGEPAWESNVDRPSGYRYHVYAPMVPSRPDEGHEILTDLQTDTEVRDFLQQIEGARVSVSPSDDRTYSASEFLVYEDVTHRFRDAS